jgi:hypothetical protein
VIAFSGEQLAMTSYGETKAKCAATGRWVDYLGKELETGRLAAPVL